MGLPMTLTEFLLERIVEDEEAAQSVLDARPEGRYSDGAWAVANLPEPTCSHVLRHGPIRVLAECEAKRRIVEEVHYDGRSGDYVAPWCTTCSDDENLVNLPCPTLRLLALPYADHPDYQPEWKP